MKNIPYKNILKLVDFLFSLPMSNAAAERAFFISNNICSSDKNPNGIRNFRISFDHKMQF